MELIEKLVRGEKVSKSEIASELYEICEREHSGCSDACPVYRLNHSEVPNKENTQWGCDTFKDGTAMYKFIKKSKPQE